MKVVEKQVIISKISRGDWGYYFHVKDKDGVVKTYTQEREINIYNDWYAVLEEQYTLNRYTANKTNILFSDEFTEEDLETESHKFSLGVLSEEPIEFYYLKENASDGFWNRCTKEEWLAAPEELRVGTNRESYKK